MNLKNNLQQLDPKELFCKECSIRSIVSPLPIYLPLVLDWVVYGKFEDTKEVIRSRKSKKDRNYNRQSKKKDNKTNDPLSRLFLLKICELEVKNKY
jgi:hypothetical protein